MDFSCREVEEFIRDPVPAQSIYHGLFARARGRPQDVHSGLADAASTLSRIAGVRLGEPRRATERK